MNGNSLFADTNILLYLLNGDETLSTLLNKKSIYLSFITELELLGFTHLSSKEEKLIRDFIEECTVIDINFRIKEKVVELRRNHVIKLPDAIIMASSIYLNIPLITADSDFKKVAELDLLFYENK